MELVILSKMRSDRCQGVTVNDIFVPGRGRGFCYPFCLMNEGIPSQSPRTHFRLPALNSDRRHDASNVSGLIPRAMHRGSLTRKVVHVFK